MAKMLQLLLFGTQGFGGGLFALLQLTLALFELLLALPCGGLALVQFLRALLEHFVGFCQVAVLAGDLLQEVLHRGVVAQLQRRIRAVDRLHRRLAFLAGSRHVAQRNSHGLTLPHQLGVLFTHLLQLLFGDAPAFHRLAVL